MTRARRWLLGLGLGGLGLGLAGLLGGVAFVAWLRTERGNEFIRQKALKQAAILVPDGVVELQGLETDLLHGLTLRGLRLRGASGEELVTIEAVELGWDLDGLLERRVRVTGLLIDRPTVNLRAGADGRYDLVALFGPASPPDPAAGPWAGLPLHVLVDELRLQGGALHIVEADGSRVDLLGLALAANGEVEGTRIDLPRLRVEGALAAPEALDLSIDGDLLYEGGDLTVRRLDLAADETRASLSGSVAGVERELALDLRARFDRVSATDVNRLAGETVLDHDLAATGTVSGRLSDLSLALDLDDAAGRAHLEGWLDTTASPLAWRFALDSPGLDVERLSPMSPALIHLAGRYAVEGEGTDWPGGITARVAVEGGEQRFAGEALRGLQVEAELAAGQVKVRRIAAEHPLGHLEASGDIDLQRSRASVQAAVDVPRLGALSAYGLTGAEGRAHFSGLVGADWASAPVVEVEGRLSGAGVGHSGYRVDRLSGPLQARYDARGVSGAVRLDVEGVHGDQVEVTKADLGFEGRWTQGSGAGEGQLSLRADGLRLGGGVVEVESVEGVVAANLDPQGALRVDSEPIWVRGITYTPTGYRVDGGPVIASVHGDQIAVEADLQRLGLPVLQGAVTGDLGSGAWQVDGLVLGLDPAQPMRSPGPGRFRLADGGVQDIEIGLAGPLGALSVQGSLFPRGRPGTDLHLVVDELDLGLVAGLAPFFIAPPKEGEAGPIDGLDGLTHIDATLLADAAGAWSLQASGALVGLRYPEVAEGIDVAVEIEGPVESPTLGLRVSAEEGLLFVGEGRLPLDLEAPGLACGEAVDLRLLLAPGELGRLHRHLLVLPELEGEASAELHLTGPACDPDVELVSAARLPFDDGRDRVRVDARVNRRGGDLHLDASVEQRWNRRFALTGEAETRLGQVFAWALAGAPEPPLDAPSTWLSSLDLRMSTVNEGIAVEELARWLDLPSGLSGHLAGGVVVQGSAESPVLEGGFMLLDGSVGTVPIDLGVLGVSPVPGGYELDLRLGFKKQGDISVSGHVPFDLRPDLSTEAMLATPGLALELHGGGLPLRLLEGLVPGVSDTQGRLKVAGNLRGSLQKPTPTLKLELRDGALSYAPLGTRYQGIDLDLSLAGERLLLHRLFILDGPMYGGALGAGKGSLEGSGDLTFDELDPKRLQVNLELDDFWLTHTDDMKIQVDSKLVISGDLPELRLRGDVDLVQGKVILGEDLFLADQTLGVDPALRIHRVKGGEEVGDRAPAPTDSLTGIDVEIKVDLQQSLHFNVTVPLQGGQLAKVSTVSAEVDLDSPEPLDVWLRDGNFGLNGTVEVRRGDMNILNRAFEVGGGSMSFVGDDMDEATFDFSAVRHTGEYGDISAQVKGYLGDLTSAGMQGSSGDAEPILSFTSDQGLEQADILSILILGKPLSDLTENESQVGLTTLFSLAGNQLSRVVGSSLRGGQFEFDEGTFKAGWPVPGADRLFLGAEWRASAETTSTTEENRFSVNLQWLITRRLYAEMVTGDAGVSDASLYWRWRF